MKIFILAAQENWITDQLAKEWIQHNKDKYTTYIQDADVIWILSNYICDALPLEIYSKNLGIYSKNLRIYSKNLRMYSKNLFRFLPPVLVVVLVVLGVVF